jgi:hypothetical protein
MTDPQWYSLHPGEVLAAAIWGLAWDSSGFEVIFKAVTSDLGYVAECIISLNDNEAVYVYTIPGSFP